MGGTRGSGNGRRCAVVMIVVAGTFGAWVGGANPAEAKIEGLKVSATSTYRLDPARGAIHVSIKADLVNTLPSQRSGAYTRTPYFDRFAVPALGPVRAATARSSVGGDLNVQVERQQHGLNILIVDLAPNLVYGQPQTVWIEFDLPGQPPRSRDVTRVNPGFASWAAFGMGDRRNIDLVIDVPRSHDVTFSKLVRADVRRAGARRVYRMSRFKSERDAFVFVSASNEQRLDTQRLDIGGTDVAVKAWPGDRRWQKFTTQMVRRGLPVLEELIGIAPPQDKLTVMESSRAAQIGYAGVYITSLGQVEVGDVPDAAVMLHELSHVWFNEDLFTERWISEGLAEEFSNRALEELGRKRRSPRPINPTAAAATPLNEWAAGGPLDPASPRVDAFGYNASYSIVHELTAEIGLENLQKVVAAAAEGHIAYQGDAPPETTTVRDWRYFYDLVDLLGESGKIGKLFTNHVANGYELTLLSERISARSELDELAATGEGWAPPLQVRKAMAGWNFQDAKNLIEQAEEALERSREVAQRLQTAGIDLHGQLESDYETADSLTALVARLDDVEESADRVVAVHSRLRAAGPFARVGLLGADVGLDEAGAAIAEADYDRVAAVLEQADAQIAAATARGIAIVLALVLMVTLFAGLTTVLILRRRAAKGRDDEPFSGETPLGAG